MPMPRRGWCASGALVIVIATLLAYIPAMRGGFIWDDDHYVEQNMTLRSLEGLGAIWHSPRATPQYYPLVHTTFWIEYQLWGLSPLGYKLVNVLLHIGSALLLWRLLARLALPGGAVAAWLAAAVFALHPVHVESVAWITERKNVLSLLLYLAAMLAMIRAMRLADDDDGPSDMRWRWYAAGVALFVMALLSKTVTCSLPAALLLIVYYKRGRVRWRDAAVSAPLFVIGACFAAMTVYLERAHVGASGGEWSLTFAERVLIAGRAVWFYASKLIWPVELAFIYPRWPVEVGDLRLWVYPIAAAAVVGWLWVARHRLGRGPIVAVCFFGGTLLPALGFFDIYPMRYSFVADHFQYHASIGLIALLASLAVYYARQSAGHARIVLIPAAVILTLLGALTWRQGHIYESRETLWRDTLAKDPQSWMAMSNLGYELQLAGDVAQAEALYRRAVALNDQAPESLGMLGILLVDSGRADEAAAYLRRAIALAPRAATYHNHLGRAMMRLGRWDDAIEAYDRALALDDASLLAHYNRALAHQRRGDIAAAIRGYEHVVSVAPAHLDARVGLVELLPSVGRTNEAIDHLRAAMALAEQAGRADLVATFAGRLRQLEARRSR